MKTLRKEKNLSRYSNRRLRTIVIVGSIVVGMALYVEMRYKVSDYPKRVTHSVANLELLRKRISHFEETTGSTPASIVEMYTLDDARQSKDSNDRIPKEYLSDKKGQNKESSALDGTGGWYYVADKGEVRINLRERLKTYLPLYLWPGRHETPCQW